MNLNKEARFLIAFILSFDEKFANANILYLITTVASSACSPNKKMQ